MLKDSTFIFKSMRYGLILLLGSLITLEAHAKPCRSSLTGDMSLALCDVSFTGTLPTFACPTNGTTTPILGTYTVTNNTPVAVTLGTPTLIIHDSQPSGDTLISANTCGSTLAPRASCLITVTITANVPLNRILQIPVNTRQVVLDSPVITPTGTCTIVPPAPPSPSLPCPLNTTASFGVLAGTPAITNTGNTVINGNLGISPAASVIGFPPGTVNGTQYINDATAIQAKADLTTLYTCLEAQPCGSTIVPSTIIADTTLAAYNVGGLNVFCSAVLNVTAPGITPITLTLDGGGNPNSVFIIQNVSALTITNANIVLAGGLTAANVFWQVTSSATLTPTAVVSTKIFNGTIVALASITMAAGGGSPAVNMSGRALARNGAVTFNNDTVTVP